MSLFSTHKFVLFWFILAFLAKTEGQRFLQLGEKCDIVLDKNTSKLAISDDNFEGANTTSSLEINSSTSACDSSFPLECISGRCQCKRGFTISRNGTKCLEIARNGLESQCEESIQCWKSLLGRLSECNPTAGKCQCYETESLPIVYHQGRCYYGEGLGDYCQIEGLCSATTTNAACRAGTCQCKEGYVPSWDKSRCLHIATQGLNSTCEENVQCEKSLLGTLSECNQETMLCQCYQIPMVPTVFHQGRCYFGAALGDVCQLSVQCTAKTASSSCGRDGKCHCDIGYVPNVNTTHCLPIPSADAAESAECIEDVQCTRALGHFARCNVVKQVCECVLPDSSYNNKTKWGILERFENITNSAHVEIETDVTSMVIVGSKCHSIKSLGESCKFNRQCSASAENSVCYNGRCECKEETHIMSLDGRKCLPIAHQGINSTCDEDKQCQHSILGPLSKCGERNKCECSSVLPVVFYEGKCFFHRPLGASCDSHKECEAGSNILAECLKGRCQCKPDTQQITDHACVPMSSAVSSNYVFTTGISSIWLYSWIVLVIFQLQ